MAEDLERVSGRRAGPTADEGAVDFEHEESGGTQDEPPVETRKRPLYKRPAFIVVAAVVIVVGVVAGLRYWAYASSHETTDDAFVDGTVVQVSPKVAGYVAKLYVKANQEVREGDLIAEIDARDYETRLEQARAALAAGEARALVGRADLGRRGL